MIKSLAPRTGSWEVRPHRAPLKYGEQFSGCGKLTVCSIQTLSKRLRMTHRSHLRVIDP